MEGVAFANLVDGLGRAGGKSWRGIWLRECMRARETTQQRGAERRLQHRAQPDKAALSLCRFAGENTPLSEPLDGAEKRRSEVFVCRCSAWVPVTRLGLPSTRRFRTDGRSRRSQGSFRGMFPPGVGPASDKAVTKGPAAAMRDRMSRSKTVGSVLAQLVGRPRMLRCVDQIGLRVIYWRSRTSTAARSQRRGRALSRGLATRFSAVSISSFTAVQTDGTGYRSLAYMTAASQGPPCASRRTTVTGTIVLLALLRRARHRTVVAGRYRRHRGRRCGGDSSDRRGRAQPEEAEARRCSRRHLGHGSRHAGGRSLSGDHRHGGADSDDLPGGRSASMM